MAEERTLPGWPKKKLVRDVRKHLSHHGIRPNQFSIWQATWAWASAIAQSYYHTHWPLPSEIASQYILLLLSEMKKNRLLKLPYRANKVVPAEVRALLPATQPTLPAITDESETKLDTAHVAVEMTETNHPSRSQAMCDNLMALIGKALKDEEVQLEPGRYEFDEVVTLHVCRHRPKENDTLCSPTVSIPLIATLALFWEKSGITQRSRLADAAGGDHRGPAAGKDTSAEIQSRMKHVEKAIQTVKEDLLDQLPKVKRSGRLITKDLRVELVPVQEELLEPVAA